MHPKQHIFILIQGAYPQTPAARSAYRFAVAALNQHRVCGVFFNKDAASIADPTHKHTTNELSLSQLWQQLAKQHGFKLYVCAAEAGKRGMIQPQSASTNIALQSGFYMAGLATLVDALNHSHRYLVFNG